MGHLKPDSPYKDQSMSLNYKTLGVAPQNRDMYFFFLINTFFAKWSHMELINKNISLVTIAKELQRGSMIF